MTVNGASRRAPWNDSFDKALDSVTGSRLQPSQLVRVGDDA
jgi:hypothetical protein